MLPKAAGAGPGRSQPGAGDGEVGALDTHRLLTFVAAISLLAPLGGVWGVIVPFPAAGAVAVVGFAVVLTVLMLLVAGMTDRYLGWLDCSLLLVGCALLLTQAEIHSYLHAAYGTDEAAFVQMAATLLLHGHNPYGANLLPSLRQFDIPAQYATYTMGGGVVSRLDYPALPVLLVAGYMWVAGSFQAIVWVNVLALTLATIMAYFMLPIHLRPLSILVGVGLPLLLGYAIGGLTTVMTIPFLLVTAFRWTGIGESGRLSRSDIGRAICLGLACSVNQLAWFIVPFLGAALWQLRTRQMTPREASRVTAHFVLIAAVPFLVLNGPFLILGPWVWLTGVLAPLTDASIVNGQGLVDLAMFFHIGGGNLFAYSAAALLAYAALLALSIRWFGGFGRLPFLLPVLPLFLSTRPLSGYWSFFMLVWLISLVADFRWEGRRGAERWGSGRPAAIGTVAAVGLCLVVTGSLLLAVDSPAPLRMSVMSVRVRGAADYVWEMSLEVENRTAKTVRPHYTADSYGFPTLFWRIESGSQVLPPYSVTRIVLIAPNRPSEPSLTPFLVVAVTTNPETVSTSSRFAPPRPSG